MNPCEAQNRNLQALDESGNHESGNHSQAATSQGDSSVPLRADATAGSEPSAETQVGLMVKDPIVTDPTGEDSMVKDWTETDLAETRARASKALDKNRNQRQISVLLGFRNGLLREESQSLIGQCKDSVRVTCGRVIARGLALLSLGDGEDSD